MYYYINPPRAESFEVFKRSILLAGKKSSYTILKPCTDIVASLYLRDLIPAEVARRYLAILDSIATFNVENNPKYAQYYEYERSLMQGEIAKIEKQIYDCTYFVNKMMPKYEENPADPDNLKTIIVTLKRQGCEAGDPFLDKVEAEYGVIASEHNAAQQAEFDANNPAVVAKKCYDAEDWDCAIAKYEEAIEKEEDVERQASYYFSIASIQFRKKNSYQAARTNARKASSLRKEWGRPYMLIGDMYAKTSSNCGEDAYNRGLAVLAAIDKWGYAKKVDSSVTEAANKKINNYNKYIPPKDEAFMIGVKEGESIKVGCWIGETVRLRTK
jgi:tetratricopeptide (TPR) repeat protein